MLKRIFIILLLLPSTSWADWSRIGTPSYVNNASATSWSHTLSQVPAVGHLVLIGVAVNADEGFNDTDCTVTDSQGDSLTEVVRNNVFEGTGAASVFIFSGIVPSGVTATVSISCTGNSSDTTAPNASVGQEYAGVAPSSYIDQHSVGGSGFADPIVNYNSGSITATSGELVVGIVAERSNSAGAYYAPDTGWFNLENDGNNPSMAFSDQLNVAAGTYAYTGQYNSSGGGTRVNSAIASFKAIPLNPSIIGGAILKNVKIN